MPKAPCMEEGCERKKYATYHRCSFHWLLTQPIEEQIQWAERRLKNSRSRQMFGMRMRVPESEWPDGERWCSGCQSYVPLWYSRKSRCIACTSRANHASHIKATYKLDPEEYDALLAWQGGKCFVCGRTPRTRRLAVDHDHATGEVRGLLCSDDERGCNHAVLGNLEASAANPLDAAKRLVAYLQLSPIERMRRGDPSPATGGQNVMTRRERIALSVTGRAEWPAQSLSPGLGAPTPA